MNFYPLEININDCSLIRNKNMRLCDLREDVKITPKNNSSETENYQSMMKIIKKLNENPKCTQEWLLSKLKTSLWHK